MRRTMHLPMLRDARGQTIAEYAIIIAAVAVILVVSLLFVGSRIAGVIGGAGDSPSESAPLRPPVAECDPNYGGGCVPPYPPDVDCSDLERLGIGEVSVVGRDPHNLDPDGDGIGCN